MNRDFPYDFLLVIPAYRESERLPPFLAELISALGNTPNEQFRCAIRVVDDGSGAEEEAKLRSALAKFPKTENPVLLPPIFLGKNLGKGAAIRAGWANSLTANDANWLGFVDADGAISAGETRRLLKIAFHSNDSNDSNDSAADLSQNPHNSHKAIFGSRVKMLGRKIERSTLRHLTGRVFASLVGRWIAPEVYDSQCGIKLIPAAAYAKIAPQLAEDRFCFDVELLAALLAADVKIVEVPIDWRDVSGSKVSLARDTLRMLAGLRRIRARQREKIPIPDRKY